MTKDHVETVVTREVQGLRVEKTHQLQSLRVELSDKPTMQFAGCSASWPS